MVDKPSYEISSKLEVVPEASKKAYPIRVEDWKFIKERIGSIKESLNIYGNVGSALIGAAVGGLIALISGDITSETKKVTCIASIIVAFVAGAASFFIGKRQQDLQKERGRDVKTFMDQIEKRFETEI